MDLSALSEALRPYWVVWMLLLFAGIVFWAFRPANKTRFEEDANIVFKDEPNGG